MSAETIVIVLIVVLVIVGVLIYLNFAKRRKIKRAAARLKLGVPYTFSTKGVSKETRKKLSRLCNGNEETLKRIVKDVHTQFPSKSPQWCWEKAIRDLERDRM